MLRSNFFSRWGLVLAALVSSPVVAAPVAMLASDPGWHVLLGYQETWSGVKSRHTDPAFFLSARGYEDPVAELAAHLDAWGKTGEDDHPVCRFPARYEWLARQRVLPERAGGPPRCEAFQRFREGIAAVGVTMVYPVPHPDSVSTLFGHSFLRLDRSRETHADHSGDYTLNFAAYVRKSDDQVDVALKGLSNGFSGIFTVIPYKKKLTEYRHMEARDLWEYRLNLSAEETERIVAHAWELRRIRADYRFFSDNCSRQMLAFLEVARPGLSLVASQRVYVIPQDSVIAVSEAGLVETVEHRPSPLTLDRIARGVVEAVRPPPRLHESGRWMLLAGAREKVAFGELRWRAAFHDDQDGPSALPAGVSIQVLDVAVRRYETGVSELESLKVFEARSLQPRNEGWAWQVGMGLTARRLASPEDALSRDGWEAVDAINPAYLRWTAGPAWGEADTRFYTLAGVEWQGHSDLPHGQEALGVVTQGIFTQGETWQATLAWEWQDTLTRGQSEPEGAVSARWTRALDTTTAVTLEGRRARDAWGYYPEAAVGMAHYF